MAGINLPETVQELTDRASNYEYNDYIPLKSWLRTASNMQREAQVYEAEGNDAQVYVILYRHANLVLEHLRTHPQANLPENKIPLKAAIATLPAELQKLEEIRPRIKKRHEDWLKRKKAQSLALQSLEGRTGRLSQELDGLSLNERGARRSFDRPSLDAEGNQSLAARLAQREVKRRDAARRGVRQAGVSEEEEQERRTGGVWVDWEGELKRQSKEGDDELQSQLQEIGRIQQNGHRTSQYASLSTPSRYSSSYTYPSVPQHTTQERWTTPDPQLPSPGSAPARPPKEHLRRESAPQPPALPPKPPIPPPAFPYTRPLPPPVPGKYIEPIPTGPPVPNKIPSPARPSTPAPELDEVQFKPSAYLENGDPLRSIFLPSQLRSHFLSAASTNTRLNLETCGMLCGILKSNALFITKLIIPSQTSTSDTCEMTNESELFDYCDSEELMVLGWIHTHPTQTCFMSSRDLHTHVGYQVMMKESIAIVCAPSKEPSWGCFRLTDPPGKQTILNCTQPGIFHPHSVDNIYTEALKPGHVVELRNAPLDVVDMRRK
ncbi:STAM binding protein [Byssothecium circinans]|uniref:STAM binding protein n=1 Tax=Byssothecium circinans TaxID=147558 RepID=A0A6A5TVT4_9PLEO|nr:STAM binding protein [Byssothecium circinans]